MYITVLTKMPMGYNYIFFLLKFMVVGNGATGIKYTGKKNEVIDQLFNYRRSCLLVI